MLEHVGAKVSQSPVCKARQRVQSLPGFPRKAATISIILTALAVGAQSAGATDGAADYTLKHEVQGTTIELGRGRHIDAWVTSCAEAWRAGDKLKLVFSDGKGMTVIDLRSRAQAKVIGLTNIADPIDTDFKICLSSAKGSLIHQEECYAADAESWHNQLRAMLRFGVAVLPGAIMENLKQNHARLRGVDLADLTETQQHFAQAARNFIFEGESVNRNLSFVGGTGWSISANATDAAFDQQVNNMLWEQLREGTEALNLQAASCR